MSKVAPDCRLLERKKYYWGGVSKVSVFVEIYALVVGLSSAFCFKVHHNQELISALFREISDHP